MDSGAFAIKHRKEVQDNEDMARHGEQYSPCGKESAKHGLELGGASSQRNGVYREEGSGESEEEGPARAAILEEIDSDKGEMPQDKAAESPPRLSEERHQHLKRCVDTIMDVAADPRGVPATLGLVLDDLFAKAEEVAGEIGQRKKRRLEDWDRGLEVDEGAHAIGHGAGLGAVIGDVLMQIEHVAEMIERRKRRRVGG